MVKFMDLQNKYFTEQIITYLGNKRTLLKEIDDFLQKVRKNLNKEKLVTADLFSGSGIVARLLKQYSSFVIANDLEEYSYVLNTCFLSNEEEIDFDLYKQYLEEICRLIETSPVHGYISKNYAPKNDQEIQKGERVFYTRRNAEYIDGFRYYIDVVAPENYKKYFLALLLTEASVHVNTSGVFKGFYKDRETGIGKFGGSAENALSRIKGDIRIGVPYLSPNASEYMVYREDAVALSAKLSNIDFAYLDPPYNQHPYGSNYFMLNLIAKNQMPDEISKVSGIPKEWNRSAFNKKNLALSELSTIVKNLQAKYILISYNDEGFITFEEMCTMLAAFGKVEYKEIEYNTFRGSRNLRERNIHTHEYLFLLQKE